MLFYTIIVDLFMEKNKRSAMVFLSELAANASKRGVPVIIYSGNDDSVVAHYSSEGRVLIFMSYRQF